jgi:hypothetical protein
MAETTWKKDIFVEKMTNQDKPTLDDLHQANNYKNIELFSNIYAKEPFVEGMDDMSDGIQDAQSTMQNGLTAVQQDYSWLLAQLTDALVQFINWYQNVFRDIDSHLLTPAVEEYVKTFSDYSSAVDFAKNVTTYNIGSLEDTINNDLIQNQLNNLEQFNETQRNDANIVKQCIYNLVYTVVATYVMYNWFYLMIYEDSEGRIKTPTPDEIWDSLWLPIRYLWRDLFQPLKVARYILLTGLPSVIKGFFNYTAICMFILLLLSWYVFSNYFDFFHQMMVDLMTPGSNCAWTSIITLLVLYSFFVHMIPSIDLSSLWTGIKSSANAYINATTWFSSFWMAILWLVLTVIRLIITIMFIPFAGIFLLIYLFGGSFFGIICANWYNKKPHSLFMTFSLINIYIQTMIDSLHKKSCGADDLMSKLLKLVNDVIFKWQLYILIIFVLLYNIFLCWTSMSTHTLKMATSGIFSIIIFFTLGFVYRKFNQKLESDTSIMKTRKTEADENLIRQANIRQANIRQENIRTRDGPTVNHSVDGRNSEPNIDQNIVKNLEYSKYFKQEPPPNYVESVPVPVPTTASSAPLASVPVPVPTTASSAPLTVPESVTLAPIAPLESVPVPVPLAPIAPLESVPVPASSAPVPVPESVTLAPIAPLESVPVPVPVPSPHLNA